MGRINNVLLGLTAGMALMYFYDPELGNRRRALARDRVTSVRNQSDRAIEQGVRDLRNRTRGLLAEGMGRLEKDNASDWVLRERVRAELGTLTRHSGAIDVDVRQGQLYLTGFALRDEVDTIVNRLGKVRGITGVENRMQIHDEPGDIPGMQGMSSAQTGRSGLWTPSTRLLATAGGGLLSMIGSMRGGLPGFLMRWGGLALAIRGVTNRDMSSLVGMKTEIGEHGVVDVRKTIKINAPIDDVYRMWENFENFPRFMNHVREIHNQGGGRSHWVVSGPAGVPVEFDAVVTEKVPNELIAWETVSDSPVRHKGRVRFTEQNGLTRVQVWMTYVPPAGALGHAVATLFGADPKKAMDEDLVRLKSLMETGETTSQSEKVYREDIPDKQRK
ncbi:MAG TPA: hypothetical protein GYA06_06820 [Chloroflexi bacterium]|mgnify:FL=1|nr:hypothetical protein [Chloroflexota bacterium]